MLQGMPSGTWATNADWLVRFEGDEEAVAVAVGGSWGACATSAGHLRLYSLSGLPLAVLSLPGPVVALAGSGRQLAVAYHRGPPTERTLNMRDARSEGKGRGERGGCAGRGAARGRSSASPRGLSSPSCARPVGDQSLGLWILDVERKRTLIRDTLPLSPGATLQWLGFAADNGSVRARVRAPTPRPKPIVLRLATVGGLAQAPITYDSSGVLRVLVMNWDGAWVPVLDVNRLPGKDKREESYWPVGVSESEFICVVCKVGARAKCVGEHRVAERVGGAGLGRDAGAQHLPGDRTAPDRVQLCVPNPGPHR